MITEAMWRDLSERRFSVNRSIKHKPRRTKTQHVIEIHKLIEDGHSDNVIAERLGVTRPQVNYRRQKLRGLR